MEVIDPAHPLFGLTLPLLRVALHERLGRVCIVRLTPGLDRLLPIAATNLGGSIFPRTVCRLSLTAITQVLAVVASLPEFTKEDADAPLAPAPTPTAAPDQLATAAAPGRAPVDEPGMAHRRRLGAFA